MTKLLITILIVTVLIGLVSDAKAQTIEEDYIDEFTGDTITRTSWETLIFDSSYVSYFRISRINNNEYFDLKLMFSVNGGKVFSIDKDQKIMFKLENGNFVKIPNSKYEITCNGCGAKGISGANAQGIKVSYPMINDQFNNLKNNLILKIRIYTTDGYIEFEPKKKHAKKIKVGLSLFN